MFPSRPERNPPRWIAVLYGCGGFPIISIAALSAGVLRSLIKRPVKSNIPAKVLLARSEGLLSGGFEKPAIKKRSPGNGKSEKTVSFGSRGALLLKEPSGENATRYWRSFFSERYLAT